MITDQSVLQKLHSNIRETELPARHVWENWTNVLTGLFAAGMNIPRIKVPRSGPLTTPITVNEPCDGIQDTGLTLLLSPSPSITNYPKELWSVCQYITITSFSTNRERDPFWFVHHFFDCSEHFDQKLIGSEPGNVVPSWKQKIFPMWTVMTSVSVPLFWRWRMKSLITMVPLKTGVNTGWFATFKESWTEPDLDPVPCGG